MFFDAGGDIPFDRFIAPRVEVELAFVLGAPLRGPGVTLADVLAATDYVTPAIEIIDARIEQFDRDTKAPRKVFDTIADFAANAGIVRRRPAQSRPTRSTCAGSARCCTRTASIEETGLAAGVLDHPAQRRRLAGQQDRRRTTSSSTPATSSSAARSRGRRRAARGDAFHVDYGPLGAIDFSFA